MNNKTLLALFDKYNRSIRRFPQRHCGHCRAQNSLPALESFVFHSGFALITGEPSYGKIETLQ